MFNDSSLEPKRPMNPPPALSLLPAAVLAPKLIVSIILFSCSFLSFSSEPNNVSVVFAVSGQIGCLAVRLLVSCIHPTNPSEIGNQDKATGR